MHLVSSGFDLGVDWVGRVQLGCARAATESLEQGPCRGYGGEGRRAHLFGRRLFEELESTTLVLKECSHVKDRGDTDVWQR